MTNTEARKIQAIQNLHARINANMPMLPVQFVVSEIMKLRPVVKSRKWEEAVDSYAHFVQTEGWHGHLNWAYGQGSVYFASHAF